MAQIDIEWINDELYRKHQLEVGDKPSTICWSYGRLDWEDIYNLDANFTFRTHYPDPTDIDPIDPTVFFYVPVPSGAKGEQRQGRVLSSTSLLSVVFKEQDGSDISTARQEFFLLNGGEVDDLEWTEPTVRIERFGTSTAQITCLIRRLEPGEIMTSAERVTCVTTSLASGATNIEVSLGTDSEVRTRRAYFVECPMCTNVYSVAEKVAGEETAVCPHDGYDLDSIVEGIDWEGDDWVTESPGVQNLSTVSSSEVVSRGREARTDETLGTVQVFWDESRFARWEDGDYTLSTQDGATTVNIRGRSSWGALTPQRGSGYSWEFHELQADAIPEGHQYYTCALPLLQNKKLQGASTWLLTLHHASEPRATWSGDAFPLGIQEMHQQDSDYADVGYHFLIDEDGVVYEGRPLAIKGAQVYKFNAYLVGVLWEGQFEKKFHETWDLGPTAAQVTAATEIMKVLAERLDTDDIRGHRDRDAAAGLREPTDCPGSGAYTIVDLVRRAVIR